MPRTVSFHLTSQTATRHGDSNFSIPLSPALEIPHTAEATVYLHNLLFDNAIANVSKNLYDNADIQIEYDGHQVNMSFDDGAYSLATLEEMIAQKLYDASLDSTTNLPKTDSLWYALQASLTGLPNAPVGLANPYDTGKFREINPEGSWNNALSGEAIAHLDTIKPAGYGSATLTATVESAPAQTNNDTNSSGSFIVTVELFNGEEGETVSGTNIPSGAVIDEVYNMKEFALASNDNSVGGASAGVAELNLRSVANLTTDIVPGAYVRPGGGITSSKKVVVDSVVAGGSGEYFTVYLKYADGSTDTDPNTNVSSIVTSDIGYHATDAIPNNGSVYIESTSGGTQTDIRLNKALAATPSGTLTVSSHAGAYYLKPLTLIANNNLNRVQAIYRKGTTVTGSLFEQFMGMRDVGVAPPSGVVNLANGAFQIVTAGHNATVDGVRAIGFHCPSLASGTYSTSGKLGGSQLGLVPIDVGIGQVVNWEASIPIKVPCKISGTKLNELHFFLSNEDGKSILLLDGRFEAVVVVQY